MKYLPLLALALVPLALASCGRDDVKHPPAAKGQPPDRTAQNSGDPQGVPKAKEEPTPKKEPVSNDNEAPPEASKKSPKPKEQPSLAQLIAAAKKLEPGAVEQLAAVGPKAIPAILDELRRDDRTYSWAAATMAKMGPGAVEPVSALLADRDSFMRKIGYMTLGQMGPIALSAVPALQRAAQQETDGRNRGLPQSAIRQITGR
jgi:hypothetical protein